MTAKAHEFPHTEQQGLGGLMPQPMVSLRDWFAGQASEADVKRHRGYVYATAEYTYTCEDAKYRYADAMILARGA
jgi:hypothetical protein